jgi:hypothetical protein
MRRGQQLHRARRGLAAVAHKAAPGTCRDLDSAALGCEAAPEHYGYRVGACFIFGGGLRSIFDDYDLDLRQECSAGGARLKYRNAGRRAAACVCIS